MRRVLKAQDLTLRVTAGPDYDKSRHVEVPVNQADTVRISSPLADVELNVRVKSFRGLPRASPADSPYFAAEPHASNKDQYSICFRFTPRKPEDRPDQTLSVDGSSGIPAADLQFGNDFDSPVRDRLPPGFGAAMRIAKWAIDPGMDGDMYADKPYLYGPAVSSFNSIHVGAAGFDEAKGGIWACEGGDEDGLARRREAGMPEGGSQRMRWALADDNKKKWTWDFGRTYTLDFFNSYLDFGNLVLRLPGYNFSLLNFWDGQPLRYVLRNRVSGDIYLVVVFSLHSPEDFGEDGNLLAGAAGGSENSETGKTTTQRGQQEDHVDEHIVGHNRNDDVDDVD